MKRTPFFALAISALLFAGMWLYVIRVLVPQQKEYAASRGIPRGNLSDLYPRWLGSRELLLHRRDPYSPEVTREIQSGYYGRPLEAARPNDPQNSEPHDQEAFAYPVYVAFLLAPTVGLPFPTVQAIFRWVLAGLTAVSVVFWLGVVKWRPSKSIGAALIILTLGTFWAVQGIRLQQLTLLVAPTMAACIYLLIKNRPVASGILLGLATVKPQIAVPLTAWLMLWACGRIYLRWKLVVAFAATLLTLVIAGEGLLPGWVHQFYAAIVAYRGYTPHLSPLDELATPLLGMPLGIAIAAAVAIICWRTRKAAADEDLFCWMTSLVLAATLLIIPTIAPYNQLLLLPGIFLLLKYWTVDRGTPRTARVLGWLAAGCLSWPWIAAVGLALLSFFTPLVRRFWEVPLWTSVFIPVPISAWLALSIRRFKLASGIAADNNH